MNTDFTNTVSQMRPWIAEGNTVRVYLNGDPEPLTMSNEVFTDIRIVHGLIMGFYGDRLATVINPAHISAVMFDSASEEDLITLVEWEEAA